MGAGFRGEVVSAARAVTTDVFRPPRPASVLLPVSLGSLAKTGSGDARKAKLAVGQRKQTAEEMFGTAITSARLQGRSNMGDIARVWGEFVRLHARRDPRPGLNQGEETGRPHQTRRRLQQNDSAQTRPRHERTEGSSERRLAVRGSAGRGVSKCGSVEDGALETVGLLLRGTLGPSWTSSWPYPGALALLLSWVGLCAKLHTPVPLAGDCNETAGEQTGLRWARCGRAHRGLLVRFASGLPWLWVEDLGTGIRPHRQTTCSSLHRCVCKNYS